MSENNPVHLGFAEEQESWLLSNRFLPSKIGGKPAWLDLQNVPSVQELICDNCEEPLLFLCQIYAGSKDSAWAIHRIVYVFICKNEKCCQLNRSENIKVFRNQLPLINNFYPDKPANKRVKCEEISSPVKLCNVCGCRGPLMCGKCKKTGYCGQIHQRIDWKTHKQVCGVEETESISGILFPEFEIECEDEERVEGGKKGKESEEEAEKRRLREYENLVKSGQAGTMTEVSDLNENLDETDEDKTFRRFMKIVESNVEQKEQVLRYNRHGLPLWISDKSQLNPSQIPKCEHCSGRRTFEFQLMPQLLNYLDNYAYILDWGIIAVYTCEKDCDVRGKYVREFCYKQDIVQGDDESEPNVNIDNLSMEDKASIVPEDDSTESSSMPSGKKKLACKKEETFPASTKGASKNTKKVFEEQDEWE